MSEFTERENQIISAAFKEGQNSELNPVAIQQKKVNSAYGIGFIEGALWADEHPKSPELSVKEPLPMTKSERRKL